MKGKVIGGLVAIIIGVCLIVLSMYIKGQTGSARENVQKGKSLFSNNPIEKAIGGIIEGAAEGKIAQYDRFARWSLYGGIILIVVGAGVVFFYRKR